MNYIFIYKYLFINNNRRKSYSHGLIHGRKIALVIWGLIHGEGGGAVRIYGILR